MEYSLRRIGRFVFRAAQNVLILILMEYSLRLHKRCITRTTVSSVLILILMEYSLRRLFFASPPQNHQRS